MTYAHKNVLFVKKNKTTNIIIILDLLIPGTAYLEDVLLVKSTKIEKSKFVMNQKMDILFYISITHHQIGTLPVWKSNLVLHTLMMSHR